MMKVLSVVVEVPHEILVVYDSDDDDTVPVVQSLQPRFPSLKLVKNTLGRGVKNAFRAGVNAATNDYILVLVADEIAPIIAFDQFLAAMDKGCEFISATRYGYGGRRIGGSMLSHLLSRTANVLFQWLTGFPFSDATTGVKMFRKQDFNKFTLSGPAVGWAVAFEMAIEAHLLGLRLGEVPIFSVDRLYGGKSSFNPWSWTAGYFKLFLWGVKAIHTARHKIPHTQDVIRITEPVKPTSA